MAAGKPDRVWRLAGLALAAALGLAACDRGGGGDGPPERGDQAVAKVDGKTIFEIASNSKEYVVVQVGADVVVFADVDGGADDAEDAVVLVGRTLADISALNFL